MKQHCCARSKLCCWQEDSQITVDLLGEGILYYGIESICRRARWSVGFFFSLLSFCFFYLFVLSPMSSEAKKCNKVKSIAGNHFDPPIKLTSSPCL